ncbi:hypothetical protein EON63_18710 [archaeon]|nr:MAG: hypothetical protein EON63_18710 [archaeon]
MHTTYTISHIYTYIHLVVSVAHHPGHVGGDGFVLNVQQVPYMLKLVFLANVQSLYSTYIRTN